MVKVLIVSKVHTHPTTMGNCWGILAQAEMLKTLGCEVHFLYLQERGIRKEDEQYDRIIKESTSYWGENIHVHIVSKVEKIFKNVLLRFRSYFCGRHKGLYDDYPFFTDAIVKDLQKKYSFDVCIVNYAYMTKLFDSLKFSKMACFTHDSFAYKNMAVGTDCFWYDAHQEAIALQKCTDVFAVQDEELSYFRILSPQSRIYNIYSKYDYNSQPVVNNNNILFLSGNNEYNVNGLKWFVNTIFPFIREKFPCAKLLVAGGICNVINGMFNDNPAIKLMGYVDSPKDFYSLGDIAINPTYQGTGLKIKTFEAIANDKVVLVHPHSLSGIYNKDKSPLFASEKACEWVSYLEQIWGHTDKINEVKKKNKLYLEDMNNYVINEYKKFIEI